MLVFVKVKRQRDDPTRSCPFIRDCSGACEWCKEHDYSEACVPLLQSEIKKLRQMQPKEEAKAETCVCCGAVIPEGRQVCPSCEQTQSKSIPHNDVISRTEAAERLEACARLWAGSFSGEAFEFAAKIVRGTPTAKNIDK
jgi:hypothetical protein